MTAKAKEPTKETEEVKMETAEVKTEKPVIAKAGKRSSKALKEAEETEKKEARKSAKETEAAKPKVKQNPPRTRLERRAKAYKAVASKIDRSKAYEVKEAITILKENSTTKFDSTIEIHLNLNVDPKQADQNIRDSIVLPAGSGKKLKVAVLTDDPKAAKEAGADIAGSDDLLAQIDKNILDFDVLIATPSVMPKLAKYARVLGPRGLMPNPRSGTVTIDITKAVKETKTGKVEYRVDPSSIIHLGIAKVSFTPEQIEDNLRAVISSIRSNKPSSVKGTFIESVYLTSTMAPSLRLDISNLS